MEYYLHLGILCGIYLILAQSFNLTFGLGNLFNLAHISAYAVGAYAVALLSTQAAVGFELCLMSALCCGGILSLFVSAVSARLKEDYLAIGTLALHAVIIALLVNWKSFTNGVLGVPGIPRPKIFSFEFQSNLSFFALTSVFVLFTLGILALVFRSSFARTLRAQAENHSAIQSLGVNVALSRTIALAISSSLAALAGGIFAYYLNYVDPTSFSLSEMVLILAIVTIGRPGSFVGVFFATLFMVLLPETLRFLDLPSSILGPARQFLYGLLLFLAVYIRRERIFALRRTI